MAEWEDERAAIVPDAPQAELVWASEHDPKPETMELYEKVLGRFRFNTYRILHSENFNHSMADRLGSIEQLQSKGRRFNNEIKAFTHGLPCHASSSIFVVMDETRMDLIKTLISGPEDSPYEHGLYLFDILCPESYPEAPPLVSIMTTGEGRVRFNPNLYDSGYVCLSIINTWDSMPEEMWNPQHSNLLQVLISIQALVMDDHVIQKEPSYESLSIDSAENRAYSEIVRYNNVKWAMLDILRSPPPEFRHVVFRHFALKKQAILNTLDAWVAQAETQEALDFFSVDPLVSEHNSDTCSLFMEMNSNYVVKLKGVVAELKDELSYLPDATTEEELEHRLQEYEALHASRHSKRGELDDPSEVHPDVLLPMMGIQAEVALEAQAEAHPGPHVEIPIETYPEEVKLEASDNEVQQAQEHADQVPQQLSPLSPSELIK